MSATYDGQLFNTPLLAQWAAFFDLAEWKWSAEIAPINNWKPDFRAVFKCHHSECRGSHTILISVLPIDKLSDIEGHPALNYRYGIVNQDKKHIADAGAIFGSNPGVSLWEMSHGSGGGIEEIDNWVNDAIILWEKAGLKVEQ